MKPYHVLVTRTDTSANYAVSFLRLSSSITWIASKRLYRPPHRDALLGLFRRKRSCRHKAGPSCSLQTANYALVTLCSCVLETFKADLQETLFTWHVQGTPFMPPKPLASQMYLGSRTATLLCASKLCASLTAFRSTPSHMQPLWQERDRLWLRESNISVQQAAAARNRTPALAYVLCMHGLPPKVLKAT